jgi:hypothetical protein
MSVLRYLLLAATATAFAALIYGIFHHRDNPWFVYTWLVVIALNFVYLVLNHPNRAQKPLRVFRMIGLWFDAKENELRARATSSEKERK